MSDRRRFVAAQAASRLGRLIAKGKRGEDRRIRRLPGPLGTWTTSRDAPEPPRQTFRQWWTTTRGAGGLAVSTDAREEVLGRIRSALAGSPAPEPVSRDYRTTGEALSSEELIDRLADRLVDYKASVCRASTAELPGVLAEILDARAARRVVVPAGLPDAWFGGNDGRAVLGDSGQLSTADLDGTNGVVTAAAVAIAETGTIVLDASPDQGRRAITLVPDLHVCVVRVDQVVESVPEGLARLEPTRPLTFISGPSATSDIELNRVEGVHGPRTLDVVLVVDSSGNQGCSARASRHRPNCGASWFQRPGACVR